MEMMPFITAYIAVVAAVLGLVMGSFINCWAWRSVNGESVAKGRSHCTSCGHELAGRDLIPIVSWLATHGKCRYCGERVSARYPATEALCAVAFCLIAVRYGFSIETIELIAFSGILLYLSLVDLDSYIIPNACILAAIAVRITYLLVAWLAFGADIAALIIPCLIGAAVLGGGVLVVALVMDRVLGRESMGGGDIKLFAVAGFYFGWQQGILLLIVSCIVGIAMALLVAPAPASAPAEEDADEDADGPESDDGARTNASTSELAQSNETADGPGADPAHSDAPSSEQAAGEQGRIRGRTIPFGPSIALACVIIMLAGEPIVAWYLGLF